MKRIKKCLLIICLLGLTTSSYAINFSQFFQTQPAAHTKPLLPLSIHTIGVLLPLTGPLADSGKAIRTGILQGYYEKKLKPKIIFINTHQYQNILTAYKQAIQSGAQVILGPLEKKNVRELAQQDNLTIPTIALNTLENNTKINHPDLIQFGLPPEQEAQAVAIHGIDKGYKRALIITPEGNWGNDIKTSFTEKWKSLGGKIIASINLTPKERIAPLISQALNINQSKARARKLRQLIGQPFHTIPRRRQDVDMVFLALPPNLARQIPPLLKFYFAGNIPIEATSLIYSGSPQPRLDKDLDGVVFCDMPWLLRPSKSLETARRQLQQNLTTHPNRYLRLYGLGLASYDLVFELNTLWLNPLLPLTNPTGELTINAQKIIQRQPSFGQFENGRPTIR